MRRFDKTSILLGAVLGVGVALLMGGKDDGEARYQIAAAGGDSTHVYILDTTTGHLWTRFSSVHLADLGTPDRPIYRAGWVSKVDRGQIN